MNQSVLTDMKRHLSRAQELDREGKSRAASGFYSAALRLAQSITGQIPAALIPPLQEAQQRLQAYARSYEEHLRSTMGDTSDVPRITQAMDILTGRAEIYHQQPNMFYFPELPQRQFYDRTEFEWCAALEANTEVIANEAVQALNHTGGFDPYLSASDNQVVTGHHAMLDNKDWGAFYLYKDGVRQDQNADLCPRTMASLEELPLPFIDGRLPSVLFSALKPSAHIPPHHGFLNTRLIAHLPLVVPGNGALRVGNQTRAWERGRLLIFDDSIEHEAWNRSEEIRIVLLFEVWRPELSKEERDAVSRLLLAVDQFVSS